GEMRAIILVFRGSDVFRGFGERAPAPPPADGAGDAAEQHADRTGRRTDGRSGEDARDASGGLSHLIGGARSLGVIGHASLKKARSRADSERLTFARTISRLSLMPGAIRLGTQGWNYDAWVGPFYPDNTKAVDFLAIYSRAFD